jgi:hypothetical protein
MAAVGMRQVVARLAGIKRKLEHFHARKTALLQQAAYFVGQKAQVLGNDLHLRASGFDGVHKIDSGALHPNAVSRGFRIRVHAPVGGEAAKVVDSEAVEQGCRRTHATNPPGIAGLLHVVPVVDRVAPELTVLAEVVRRNASYAARSALFVQLKLLGRAPDVRTVQRNIDGQIAHNLNAVTVGVGFQPCPLFKEQPLNKLVEANAFFQAFARGIQSGLFAHTRFIRPFAPGNAAVFVLEGHKQRVVLQPVRVLLRKLIQRAHLFGILHRARESAFQHGKPVEVDFTVIHLPRGGTPVDGVQRGAVEQAFVLQRFKVDKVRVARESGKGLIRRIAVSRRAKRQHLPVTLAGAFELVDERIGFPPERTDAVRGGKGRNVH